VNRRYTLRTLVALCALSGVRVLSAQKKLRVWRVGFLTLSSASLSSATTDAFLKAMLDLGYVEGENLTSNGVSPTASSNACRTWQQTSCS
jgi:hypothetical protein